MNHYELFRTKLAASLIGAVDESTLQRVLTIVDGVSVGFDISKACTDLIVPGVLPDVAKMYLAALAVENKAAGTLSNYKLYLTDFFQTIRKPYNAVTTNDVRVYLYQYQQKHGVKKSTLDHIRIVINSFYSWAVDEELMERSPTRRIRPMEKEKTERTSLQQIDLERLRLACTSNREKALVDFLYSTGCRISECAAVNLSDIDWRERSVKIRHGKGDKSRTVYFNAESEVSLRKYLMERKGDSSALFTSFRAPYGRVGTHALQIEVKKIRERAIVTAPVTPHVLRHTFATTAIDHGMPVQEVQQLMGHARLDTTMIYAHQNQESIRSNYRKFVI